MVHSLRFKLTAITIVEIIAAILCLSLASIAIVQAEINRRSVEVMSLFAKDTQKSIEKQTEDVEQSVETAAGIAASKLDGVTLVQCGIVGPNATLADRTPEQIEQFDAYLAEYTGQIEQDFAGIANHTRGGVTYYYCISPDVSIANHGFFYSRVGKTGFARREPIDARELDPNDLAHTTWYYTPIGRGRPSWVGPYTAHFLDEMWINSYLAPIYKSGTFIGVLGMDIPLESIVSQVSSVRVYETGFACLLDENGTVLYHPEHEFGTEWDRPVSKEVLSQHDSGDTLIRYTAADGQERQLSFTTLTNGMKLAIIAPTSEINASSAQLIWTTLPFTIIVVVLIGVLSMLAMRHITMPLQSLTAASQRLAAADYDVTLDYKGKDEVGALTSAFQQMRDRLQEYIANLNRRILTDDLTGLPNQRHFFDLAAQECKALIEIGKTPFILYFNLVGMKHFNRQHGFAEGDALIREVAGILARHFGEQRTSRFGQDHFVAVTDGESLEERLYRVFDECRIANGGKSLPVSVGIYQVISKEAEISVACDRAKYACDTRKGTYVSGFRYFDTAMHKRIDISRHVISHIDQAIDERWIEVYYQPIVRAVNGKVCDEEALSRWIDPVRGFLSPADFIPALEGSGLIYKLDLYVLDRVLEKTKQLEEAGLFVVPHSINLSRSDFEACDMVEEIRTRVDAAGVSRDLITIEITESIIGSDFDYMKRQVERFRALGFPVWMDDFGSGYSSLDFLQSIQFDLLKFDMSFLRTLESNERSKVILTELMQMATALGVDTLCEGVETEQQVRFLREIGCSKLQGYYYCKPISFEGIIERNKLGIQIGYENPDESDYFEAIGRVNLHDLTSVAEEEEASLQNTFDTLPMAIVEISRDTVDVARTNQSFRDFIHHSFSHTVDSTVATMGYGTITMGTFINRAHELSNAEGRVLFDETLYDGSVAHFMVRRVRTNPVTGATAMAVAVLSITTE